MMIKNKKNNDHKTRHEDRVSASTDDLLLASLNSGDDSFQTGRYLVTFKEGATEEAMKFLKTIKGMRVADARDFEGQATDLESIGDADAILLPELGIAIVGGAAAKENIIGEHSNITASNPIVSIDPEYFVFADTGIPGKAYNGMGRPAPKMQETMRDIGSSPKTSNEYLRGFLRAAQMIAQDLKFNNQMQVAEDIEVLGATWGLNACKVPPSTRSGRGIRLAALTSGLDFGHPDFIGREIISQTFVGQPVQDLFGHGTHMIGTACGPKSPAGSIPRYGIGYHTSIYIAKVISNSGAGTTASILSGFNWAIANRCAVILAPLSSGTVLNPVFTGVGNAALNNDCLIIAGSSSSGSLVGAPANSSSIMSVGAVDQNLTPTSFSPIGKIDIAAPGRDIFSSYPRPLLYQTWSGIASAAAHVAGCAALWAETSPALRGRNLWRKLLVTAKPLPFPATRVGAGLVQAP